MAYLNKIDINGRTYYLQHLTDGKNEAMLPTPVKDDQLLLRSQVVNNVTNDNSKNGYYVPLSARQGYLLNINLNQEINNREADVDEEQARAEAAELALTNRLDKEIQDRIYDVDTEESRAMAAEKVLIDKLAKEIKDRTDDVNAEETRALAAENVLTDNLAQEVIDRTNAVTTEQNRAVAKEDEISANLTAEINRAKTAEQTNATAIATEQSRAKGVESNHESRIVTMETFFKEADIDASKEFIDTLKEIQTYIADDKTGASAMAASIQANKTAIETEATAARAAEKANADAIAVLNGSANGSVAKAVNDAKIALETEIAKKVDKVDGKGLSDQNYTADEKTKLEGIEDNANKYVHPSYDIVTSGLYKITVDEFGHVSSVVAVTKDDIINLGVPAQDTTYENATTSDSGLLSSADKATYDGYAATIASLQSQIDELKALVESYHPTTEPDETE